MSDPASAAKAARESLARALAAIQSNPQAPPALMSVAEPVSSAMGALFQIERSGGAAVAQSGPQALAAVRQALALLQQQPSNVAAVQQASEAVAGALGLVHGLASGGPAAAPRPPPAPQPAAAPQAYAPPAAPYAQTAAVPYAPAGVPQAPAPARAPAPAPAPAPAAAPPAPQPPQGHGPQAYAATQVAAGPAAAPAEPRRAPPQPEARAAAEPPAVAGPRVEAELGAHSPSNFYKGLSGNDVVEHGGLFVSTYNIPPIGQALTLHVSMPGGYEFDALAVVRWTRDTVESGQGAPPGFGAQFTKITPEARQLVYRYVRNREPLFHDDI